MPHQQSRTDAAVVAVFVKAPLAGRVKTRLAAEIGPLRAAQLYRRLGRMTLKAVTGGEYRTVAWYAPRRGVRVVRAWLRGLGVSRFRPQVPGDLGRRLAATFAGHFREGARRVVVVGSDCPGVSRALIGEALDSLDEQDIVLGPARDGGYYLIGLRAPAPGLFRSVAWSTDGVLEQTLQRARALGLRPELLPTLRDVDTVSDARAVGVLP